MPKRKNREGKDQGGRPTKYNTRYNNQAYCHCLLGATDDDLAELFEVDVSTINNWKIEFPKFFESIKKGKAQADAKVANSLFKRATGYSHKATKFIRGKDAEDEEDIIKMNYTERFPPDTTAAIFWLKNRKKDVWRDKQEVEATVKHEVSDEQLKRILSE